ncbi:MAG: CBS domain-containing protein, partial [Thermostichus sp. DG02_5_bins_236]
MEEFLELVPLLVSPTHSVISVVKLLAQRGSPFRYALVGDPQRLVSIFTATDALQWLAQEWRGEGVTLGQIMSTPVITFAARDYRDPLTLLQFIQARESEHLPIVDERGSLLGVVSQEDLCLKLLQNRQVQPSSVQNAVDQALFNLDQLQQEILEKEL